MPWQGGSVGGSSLIFAKGKESHPRADVEKVSRRHRKGSQLSGQKGWRSPPRDPRGQNLLPALSKGGRGVLLQAKEEEQTSLGVKEVGAAITGGGGKGEQAGLWGENSATLPGVDGKGSLPPDSGRGQPSLGVEGMNRSSLGTNGIKSVTLWGRWDGAETVYY